MVDAIEEAFVPVCVYNNTKGDDDARILGEFKEPSWNNPVVRIVDGEKKDIIPRISDDWTLKGLAFAMVEALKKQGHLVPAYLDLWVEEKTAVTRGVERAIFGME